MGVVQESRGTGERGEDPLDTAGTGNSNESVSSFEGCGGQGTGILRLQGQHRPAPRPPLDIRRRETHWAATASKTIAKPPQKPPFRPFRACGKTPSGSSRPCRKGLSKHVPPGSGSRFPWGMPHGLGGQEWGSSPEQAERLCPSPHQRASTTPRFDQALVSPPA